MVSSAWISKALTGSLIAFILAIESASGFGLVAGLHLLHSTLEGLPHTLLFRSTTSYLFWLGLPCLLYIASTTWFCRRRMD